MGDDLESEVGACRVTGDLDVLWLNAGGDEMFNRRYSLLELSGKGGGW